MKNYIAPGKTVSVTTPAGGLVSGAPVKIGALFGVANLTTLEGERNELSVEGVFAFEGAGAVGDVAYFDEATDELATASAPGLFIVGVVVGIDGDKIEVRLNGTGVSAVEAA